MTINELAKMAGVSISTVSKVMNNKDSSISKTTKERILELAKEYHYSPPSSPLSKKTRTLTIGVVFRSSGRINLTLNGILDAAQEKGYTPLLRESRDDLSTERKNLLALLSYNVDGILWEPVSEDSLAFTEDIEAKGVPYIIFNHSSEDAMDIDYRSLGYLACEELIKRGHQHIACLLTEGERSEGFEAGYRQCLFDNRMSLSEDQIFPSITDKLLWGISRHRISGVVSSHFRTATRLYDEIHALYYTLPYDVSLISLRDAGKSGAGYPRISTMTIPHYEYGAFMCGKLINVIEDPSQDLPSGPFRHEIHLDSTDTIGIPYDSRKKHMVVLGSVNIDNYLNVEALPYSGKTVKSYISASYAGGKGLNTAVGVSMLGHQAALIGNVGSDAGSDLIFSTLNSFHINPSTVRRIQGEQTGQAHIFVQPDGESMITIMSGANNQLNVSDIEKDIRIFENAACCLLSTEIPLDTIERAAAISREKGITTILKPATCGELPSSILKNVDILIPNESELNEICPSGKDLKEKAQRLMDLGAGSVIVTLGERGSILINRNGEKLYPAHKFDAVDSSGACDAFISALASYLLYGYDMDRAIRIATYAAGLSVTRQGVIPALTDKNSLESYIRQREPELLD